MGLGVIFLFVSEKRNTLANQQGELVLESVTLCSILSKFKCFALLKAAISLHKTLLLIFQLVEITSHNFVHLQILIQNIVSAPEGLIINMKTNLHSFECLQNINGFLCFFYFLHFWDQTQGLTQTMQAVYH